ncbi:MAG: PSD1 and planctomycete cytochrome C domain-containing protein [Planctomycetota bacterium]|nr:PSD1 and planctomycete cytochrome C domain-containing protein [Planctomycetota bacterium]
MHLNLSCSSMVAKKTPCIIILALNVVLYPLCAQQAGPAKMTARETHFFEQQIRPLLVANCISCHGPQKQENNLRLDSQAMLLKGGDSGTVVEPGKPDESLLIAAVQYDGLEMPPKQPLTRQQIDHLRQWIKDGAKWPPVSDRALREEERPFTPAEQEFWSFQPIAKPRPPGIRRTDSNPIDRFIFVKLRKQGLRIAPPAQPEQLIRRLYLDLTGLLPPIESVTSFVEDPSDSHYQKIVDELLQSPRHGERWSRFWLDLVRYAESDGYNSDDYRENAWRYRDYVIDSFNTDKPYDQFIREQIAGDELYPHDQQALIATGYLRHWIYEYNQRDAKSQWSIILNDITDVTGDAILGLGMSCARCHDHKFDPILQKDYFRLQAFFAPLLPVDSQLAGTPQQQREYQIALNQWETESTVIRKQIEAMQSPVIESTTTNQIEKFPLDVRPALYKQPQQRTPYEKQLAYLAFRQVEFQIKRIDWSKQFKDEELEKWEQLSAQLATLNDHKPKPLGNIAAVTDIDKLAPPTVVPDSEQTVEPGGLSLLDPLATPIVAPPGNATTGRRSALANWLTSPDNPLTSRVFVNRIWQHHFGQGLVSTPSDFGTLGTRPSHPRLLDFLAATFMQNQWSIKHLHRMIVTSQTYRQSALHPQAERARQLDPSNRWLWRANIRRLDSEQIRDNMLYVSGELNLQSGGSGQADDSLRRSIFLKVIRNQPNSLLLTFDGTDPILSTPERNTTTTPTQALLMMNNPWILKRANKLADHTRGQHGDQLHSDIQHIHRLLYSREPTEREYKMARDFLAQFDSHETGWRDYCHVLLAANEFFYIQ